MPVLCRGIVVCFSQDDGLHLTVSRANRARNSVVLVLLNRFTQWRP